MADIEMYDEGSEVTFRFCGQWIAKINGDVPVATAIFLRDLLDRGVQAGRKDGLSNCQRRFTTQPVRPGSAFRYVVDDVGNSYGGFAKDAFATESMHPADVICESVEDLYRTERDATKRQRLENRLASERDDPPFQIASSSSR